MDLTEILSPQPQKRTLTITPYTECCNRYVHLISDIYQYFGNVFEPKVMALRNDSSRKNRAHDAAVGATVIQTYLWLGSLSRMNQIRDFLAIAAASRSLFEQHLDIAWLKTFDDPIWATRYWAYPAANRHTVANKVISHKAKTSTSTIDPRHHIEWVKNNPDADPLKMKHWTDGNGNPRNPGHHWTGIGDLRQRAKALGPRYEDTYLQLYPILSWLVHAGPTAICQGDIEEIEKHIAFALSTGVIQVNGIMLLATDILAIEDGLDELVDFVQGINEKLDDAFATYGSQSRTGKQ
ncbi:MAG TPA: DUF5677 domain-containing protein [Tepidisphaeraceae bacterium]|jgi:hypothetical protein|nr:DUF5677 domain-containing protein [Tepidisphaeraceae bacterium]